jgi:hypothetical protein
MLPTIQFLKKHFHCKNRLSQQCHAGVLQKMYALAQHEAETHFQLHPKGMPRVVSKEQETVVRSNDEFFPKGAIAFFVTMLIGFALIWLGMYVVMVHRR